MPKHLTKLRIDEISSVDRGAGEDCKVVLMKRLDDAPMFFDDIMKRRRFRYVKADVSDPDRGDREEPDEDKLGSKLQSMVDAMLLAAPTLSRQEAHHYLLHSAHGRKLYDHLSKTMETKPMPQINITKVFSIMEDVLMAQVTKRDGESFAQSFSRKIESDRDYAKQWSDLHDTKNAVLLAKMATLTPTSVGVGSSLVEDDSAEAVRLLQAMAAKNGRSFEAEFGDVKNAKLAARTYTSAHRSSPSWDTELNG